MNGKKISELPSGVPTLSGIIPFTNDAKNDTLYTRVDDLLKIAPYDTSIADNVQSVQVGGASPTLASEWKNKTIVEALDTILFPTILPTSTSKSASLSISGSTGLLEIGSTVNRVLTATFNRGLITNGDGSTGPQLVGAATNYTFTGTNISSTSQVNNTLSVTNVIVSGSNGWTVVISHSAGTGLYYDNKNNVATNLDSLRNSGTVSANSSPSVTGIYPYFYGVSDTTLTANQIASEISSGNLFTCSLNANITTLTISNAPQTSGVAMGFTLIFTADGTARSVTWPGSVKWPGGVAPTLTSTNAKIDVLSFISADNGTTWLGFVGGQNY